MESNNNNNKGKEFVNANNIEEIYESDWCEKKPDALMRNHFLFSCIHFVHFYRNIKKKK